eukprot:3519414-Amphidinium_carterae.1
MSPKAKAKAKSKAKPALRRPASRACRGVELPRFPAEGGLVLLRQSVLFPDWLDWRLLRLLLRAGTSPEVFHLQRVVH